MDGKIRRIFSLKYPEISNEISKTILKPPDSNYLVWTLSKDGEVSSIVFLKPVQVLFWKAMEPFFMEKSYSS